jgi:2-oxo-3-hexenedioate decarboxylase
MTPISLLQHYDSAELWPSALSDDVAYGLPAAYQDALALRALRLARGEKARGFKLGFTNRSIWPIYGVYAPIWGTVYDSTLQVGAGEGRLSASGLCQPRIEPEIVFGMRHTPAPKCSLEDLFDAIEWLAPGFELVQTHLPNWKFKAADAVADGGLHGRLVVGQRLPVREFAANATQLIQRLAAGRVRLVCDGKQLLQGQGSLVMDSPLQALHHFVAELAACPGAPALLPGDVVTTGTWTDALPVQAGQTWRAEFDAPLPSLQLHLD